MIGRLSVWGTLALLLAGLASEGEASGPPPLSNAAPALEELAKDVADQSKPVAERLSIVRTLGVWGTADVRAPLLAALKDPAPTVREAAARALGWSENREAVAGLRERVEASDEAPTVRAAAVNSLGIIGDPSVRSVVVAATQDPDARVREQALWSLSLGPLADPADRTSYLIRIAEDSAIERQLRSEAIRTLAGVKEDRVVEVLTRLLADEPRIPIALPESQLNQQQIMALRYAEARDVAAWAAGALGELNARGALPLMLKAADDPTSFFLRMLALRSLVAWDVPEALPVFIRRLGDPLPDNRVVALMGLAKRGDRTAIAAVLGRLSDPSPEVRAQAVATVAILGDASARPQLEELRQKESAGNVQMALEDALKRLPR